MSDAHMPILPTPLPPCISLSGASRDIILAGKAHILVIEIPRLPGQERWLRAIPGSAMMNDCVAGVGLLFPHIWNRETGDLVSNNVDSIKYRLRAWREFDGHWRVLDASVAGLLHAVDGEIEDAEEPA